MKSFSTLSPLVNVVFMAARVVSLPQISSANIVHSVVGHMEIFMSQQFITRTVTKESVLWHL